MAPGIGAGKRERGQLPHVKQLTMNRLSRTYNGYNYVGRSLHRGSQSYRVDPYLSKYCTVASRLFINYAGHSLKPPYFSSAIERDTYSTMSEHYPVVLQGSKRERGGTPPDFYVGNFPK